MKKIIILLYSLIFLEIQLPIAQTKGYCGGIYVVKDNSKFRETKEESIPCKDFSISLEYDISVPDNFRPIIDFASLEWSELIDSSEFNNCQYKIKVKLDSIESAGTLAYARTTLNSEEIPIYSEIVISNREEWYLDPEPYNDNEFNEIDGVLTNNSESSIGFDLLSIVRHEIGHAVGWISSNRISQDIIDFDYDTLRLNIRLNERDSGHTSPIEHPTSIMNPEIGSGTRKGITKYPDLALLAKAFHYQIVGLKALSPTSQNPQGSVYNPYNDISIALLPQNIVQNETLIILPGIYNIDKLTMRLPITILSTRGKKALIK